MPKKAKGYTPKRGQSNPTEKQSTPMKSPSMPNPMNGGPNKVATLPGSRFPKLTKPSAMAPRTPKI